MKSLLQRVAPWCCSVAAALLVIVVDATPPAFDAPTAHSQRAGILAQGNPPVGAPAPAKPPPDPLYAEGTRKAADIFRQWMKDIWLPKFKEAWTKGWRYNMGFDAAKRAQTGDEPPMITVTKKTGDEYYRELYYVEGLDRQNQFECRLVRYVEEWGMVIDEKEKPKALGFSEVDVPSLERFFGYRYTSPSQNPDMFKQLPGLAAFLTYAATLVKDEKKEEYRWAANRVLTWCVRQDRAMQPKVRAFLNTEQLFGVEPDKLSEKMTEQILYKTSWYGETIPPSLRDARTKAYDDACRHEMAVLASRVRQADLAHGIIHTKTAPVALNVPFDHLKGEIAYAALWMEGSTAWEDDKKVWTEARKEFDDTKSTTKKASAEKKMKATFHFWRDYVQTRLDRDILPARAAAASATTAKKWKEAEEAYKKLIPEGKDRAGKIDPHLGLHYYDYGRMLMEAAEPMHNYRTCTDPMKGLRAIEMLTLSRRYFPRRFDLGMWFARCHTMMEQYKKARDELDGMLKTIPDLSDDEKKKIDDWRKLIGQYEKDALDRDKAGEKKPETPRRSSE